MAGNKKITELAVVPTPVNGAVYVVKDGVDYQTAPGAANGLATLDATGKVPSVQLTPTAWGTITGTLSSQTDLQTALNAKYNTTGGVLSGAISTFIGTVSTAQIHQRLGWSNAITRWVTGVEADGSYSMTSFDSAGGTPTTSLQISTVAAGGTNVFRFLGNTIWHSGNDGAGSGLDADLLDGQQATSFAAATHSHAISNVTGLQASLDSKIDDSQATTTGLAVLGAATQDGARIAVGVYVQASDPGAVADGSLWFF